MSDTRDHSIGTSDLIDSANLSAHIFKFFPPIQVGYVIPDDIENDTPQDTQGDAVDYSKNLTGGGRYFHTESRGSNKRLEEQYRGVAGTKTFREYSRFFTSHAGPLRAKIDPSILDGSYFNSLELSSMDNQDIQSEEPLDDRTASAADQAIATFEAANTSNKLESESEIVDRLFKIKPSGKPEDAQFYEQLRTAIDNADSIPSVNDILDRYALLLGL